MTQNRVVIGLPDRYEKAKQAIARFERREGEIRSIITALNTGGIGPDEAIEEIDNVLSTPVKDTLLRESSYRSCPRAPNPCNCTGECMGRPMGAGQWTSGE